MDGIATEIQRDAAGRFVPGQSGNPAGKTAGTRNRKSVMLEALRDGEGEAAARVVIDKALAGDAVAARFVVALISPKPRGRTIQLEMPEDDDCNVVTAFNVTLRGMCQGEITPEEALTVSRVLDGRRRALQAWQLEEKLTSYGGAIPGDPERAPGPEDDNEDEDDDDEVVELSPLEAAVIQRWRQARAADAEAREAEAREVETGETARSGSAGLQTPCISRSAEPGDGPAVGDSSRALAILRGLGKGNPAP